MMLHCNWIHSLYTQRSLDSPPVFDARGSHVLGCTGAHEWDRKRPHLFLSLFSPPEVQQKQSQSGVHFSKTGWRMSHVEMGRALFLESRNNWRIQENRAGICLSAKGSNRWQSKQRLSLTGVMKGLWQWSKPRQRVSSGLMLHKNTTEMERGGPAWPGKACSCSPKARNICQKYSGKICSISVVIDTVDFESVSYYYLCTPLQSGMSQQHLCGVRSVRISLTLYCEGKSKHKGNLVFSVLFYRIKFTKHLMLEGSQLEQAGGLSGALPQESYLALFTLGHSDFLKFSQDNLLLPWLYVHVVSSSEASFHTYVYNMGFISISWESNKFKAD